MTATFANRHPLYQVYEADWKLCRDVYEGERRVKDEGECYLKPTQAQREDGYGTIGERGQCDYESYKHRAQFHAYLRKAVRNYLGQLWHREPTIELPPRMEPLLDSCTRKKDSMMQLLREMHEELLVTGRLGLLGDLPEFRTTEDILPYISMYKAESIINWDVGNIDETTADSLNMVVLDETTFRKSSEFTWIISQEFRVLILEKNQADVTDVSAQNGTGDVEEQGESVVGFVPPKELEEDQPAAQDGGVYRNGLFKMTDVYNPEQMTTVAWRGKTLEHIPFLFVNAQDMHPAPSVPPQADLARQDISIYNSEADYRQTLFMQSQYTLTIIGDGGTETPGDGTGNVAPKPIRTGVGALIRIPTPGATVQYVGIDGVGLPEQRSALENDMRRAEVMSGSLTDTSSQQKESADAMSTRMAGETIRLVNIAITAAEALQKILRMIAEWIGEDPEKVNVKPNKDFDNTAASATDLLALQQSKMSGFPLSDESLHMVAVRSGFTDKDYETELEDIAKEEPRIDATGTLTSLAPSPLQEQLLKNAKNPQPAPAPGSPNPQPGPQAKPGGTPKPKPNPQPKPTPKPNT